MGDWGGEGGPFQIVIFLSQCFLIQYPRCTQAQETDAKNRGDRASAIEEATAARAEKLLNKQAKKAEGGYSPGSGK